MHHLQLSAEVPTLDRRDVVLQAFLDAVGGGRLEWLGALLQEALDVSRAHSDSFAVKHLHKAAVRSIGLHNKLREATNAAKNLGLLPR